MRSTNKGITLIALVITIIILLILAAVSINLLFGETGVIERSKEAKFKTHFRSVEEQVELYKADQEMKKLLGEIVEKELPIKNGEISDETKNEFPATLTQQILERRAETTVATTEETINDVNLYYIDKNLLSLNLKHDYIMDVENEQIYDVQGEKYYGKMHHYLDMDNINEDPIDPIDPTDPTDLKIGVGFTELLLGEGTGWTSSDSSIVTVDESGNITGVKAGTATVSNSNNETYTITVSEWSDVYDTTKLISEKYSEGQNATIPKGFQVSWVKGQTSVNEGLVVRDASTKNEFVWIPVTDINEFKLKDFDSYNGTVISTEDENGILNVKKDYEPAAKVTEEKNQAMYDSVNEYKGFYISRYYASLDTDISNLPKDEMTIEEIRNMEKNNIVFQENKVMLSVLDFDFYNGDDNGITNANEMNNILSGMYNDSSSPVVSTLMYDVQYDAVVQWICETNTPYNYGYEKVISADEDILFDPILIKKFSLEGDDMKYKWTRMYLDDIKNDGVDIQNGQGTFFAVSGLKYITTEYDRETYKSYTVEKVSGNINNIADFNTGTCCMTQGKYIITEEVWDDNIEGYVSIDKELISLRGVSSYWSSDFHTAFLDRNVAFREAYIDDYNYTVPDMYTMSRAALYIK